MSLIIPPRAFGYTLRASDLSSPGLLMTGSLYFYCFVCRRPLSLDTPRTMGTGRVSLSIGYVCGYPKKRANALVEERHNDQVANFTIAGNVYRLFGGFGVLRISRRKRTTARTTIQATEALSKTALSVSKARHSIFFSGTLTNLRALGMCVASSLIAPGVRPLHPKLKRSVTAQVLLFPSSNGFRLFVPLSGRGLGEIWRSKFCIRLSKND